MEPADARTSRGWTLTAADGTSTHLLDDEIPARLSSAPIRLAPSRRTGTSISRQRRPPARRHCSAVPATLPYCVPSWCPGSRAGAAELGQVVDEAVAIFKAGAAAAAAADSPASVLIAWRTLRRRFRTGCRAAELAEEAIQATKDSCDGHPEHYALAASIGSPVCLTVTEASACPVEAGRCGSAG